MDIRCPQRGPLTPFDWTKKKILGMSSRKSLPVVWFARGSMLFPKCRGIENLDSYAFVAFILEGSWINRSSFVREEDSFTPCLVNVEYSVSECRLCVDSRLSMSLPQMGELVSWWCFLLAVRCLSAVFQGAWRTLGRFGSAGRFGAAIKQVPSGPRRPPVSCRFNVFQCDLFNSTLEEVARRYYISFC